MVIEYYSPKELNLVAFPKTGQYIIRTPDDHAVNQGIVVKRVQTNHGVVNNKHGKYYLNPKYSFGYSFGRRDSFTKI